MVFLTNALVLGVALLLLALTPITVHAPIEAGQFALLFAGFVVLLLLNVVLQALANSFNAMLDRLEHARHEAARTALAAQDAERLRVARELHDEIGQTLTAVTIQAERAAHGDSELAQALRAVADGVREGLDDVRRIARELRPEALDDVGLVNALIALCGWIAAQGGPHIARALQRKLPPLSSDMSS